MNAFEKLKKCEDNCGCGNEHKETDNDDYDYEGMKELRDSDDEDEDKEEIIKRFGPKSQDSRPGDQGRGGSFPLKMTATSKSPSCACPPTASPIDSTRPSSNETSVCDKNVYSSVFNNGFISSFDTNSFGTQTLQKQAYTKHTIHNDIGYVSPAAMHDVLKIFELDDTDELLAAADARPRVVRVALDSGAGDHVASPDDIDGMVMEESPGSRADKHFIAANGQRIKNRGQVQAKMVDNKLGTSFGSTFQVADVSRPLYSVSKMCDAGAKVEIDAKEAVVKKGGRTLARFVRQGGLYVAEFTMSPREPATGFPGQGTKR